MRTLGSTGLSVSPLGLSGSYGLEGNDAERAFHELGINYWFVTPRTPDLGAAVKRLVAAGHRDRLVLAAGANVPFGWSVKREFEKVAKSLGVEHIDVFHLFWVQAHWYVSGNTWKEMRKLKEQGLVRTLAVSCHDRPLARRLVDELDLDVLMIRYNAAHRGAEREIFDSLPEKRPGIVAYTATRWGRLMQPISSSEPDVKMSAPECYRFALAHPKVDTVLTAPRSWAELKENVEGVARGALDEARLAEVKSFGDRVRASVRGRIGFLET